MAGSLILTAAVGAVSAAQPGALTARPSTIDFHKRQVGNGELQANRDHEHEWRADVLLRGERRPYARRASGFGLMPGSTCPALAPEPLAAGDSLLCRVWLSPTEFFAGWVAERGTLIATTWEPIHWNPTLVELRDPCHRGRLSVAGELNGTAHGHLTPTGP